MQTFFVYILSDRYRKILYVGVTRNLHQRMTDHKTGAIDDFTKQYGLRYLLHYEIWDSLDKALARETQLKKWHRAWKLDLIKESNPTYRDLSDRFTT